MSAEPAGPEGPEGPFDLDGRARRTATAIRLAFAAPHLPLLAALLLPDAASHRAIAAVLPVLLASCAAAAERLFAGWPGHA